MNFVSCSRTDAILKIFFIVGLVGFQNGVIGCKVFQLSTTFGQKVFCKQVGADLLNVMLQEDHQLSLVYVRGPLNDKATSMPLPCAHVSVE